MTQTQYARRRLAQMPTRAAFDASAQGSFEGYASLWNVPDASGDAVARGAFAASLRKRPPHAVRLLYQHFAHEPIGVWDVIREDARGLYVKGHLTLDVERARDVAALLRDGALNGLSIGFRTKRAVRNANGTRSLTELELWEISIVTFPMLPQAQVTAISEKSAWVQRLRVASHVFQFTKPALSSRTKRPPHRDATVAQIRDPSSRSAMGPG